MMHAAPHTVRLEQPDLLEPGFEPEPQPSVIVIDDSATVRAVVKATLERIGVPVTPFKDGLSALGALVRQEVDQPDLVLIDIGLPRMDGYEITQILRSKPELKEARLVMLSAHDGPINKVRAAWCGANGFIAKPFRTNYLIEQVLNYLRRGPVM